MFWSKSKQPKAQRSQWWVSFTRVENYQTNNQFCCLGRYLGSAYLATRSWWPALRAGAYQINQQTIIVFLFAVVVVINLDDGVCRSLLIVIAVSGTMFKPLSLATWTFVWQLERDRKTRERDFCGEAVLPRVSGTRTLSRIGCRIYIRIQKIEMITDT